mmetsp:Transcript_6347/g.18896  ORF Transcript_6347/g.18896 Transcript_6347/m.18896 type:complete len:219 (+) Transcript_6347:929-1585(+)
MYTIFSAFRVFTVTHTTLSPAVEFLLILEKIAPCASTSSSSSYVPIAFAISPLILLEIDTSASSSPPPIEDHFSENLPFTNATTFAPDGASARSSFISSSAILTSSSSSSSLINVALVISATSKNRHDSSLFVGVFDRDSASFALRRIRSTVFSFVFITSSVCCCCCVAALHAVPIHSLSLVVVAAAETTTGDDTDFALRWWWWFLPSSSPRERRRRR